MPNPAFDPQATGFSMPNAQLLGQAAAISYGEPPACAAWAAARGFDPAAFDFFDHCDTQGFVAQNDRMILVAFRGTQPNRPVDWMSDFQTLHETWGHPVGTVHKGFYEALRVIWGLPLNGREILPKRLVDRGDRTVWITGHSLGGALAELCAAQTLLVSHVPVQGVYTFGQPRVGDEAFAKLLQAALGSRIFRFVNDRDIVPRVPLFGMGYRHYGGETFFDHTQATHDLSSAVENLAAALRFAVQAVNLDPIVEAGKLVAEAVSKAGLLGDPTATLQEMMKQRESDALGDVKLILASGTENIKDHNMRDCYLARLGTSL